MNGVLSDANKRHGAGDYSLTDPNKSALLRAQSSESSASLRGGSAEAPLVAVHPVLGDVFGVQCERAVQDDRDMLAEQENSM